MDLETENRIAAILMKEAAELRRQAERDGVDAYLHSPNARGRPNSRFLTATVLGVQQANRVVEVNEMWRVRQKEKELDDRAKKDEKRETSHSISGSQRNTSARIEDYERKGSSICSSSKRSSENGGLRDNEIEEFLHSRVKRGRGAVGSRMDETGPYLPGSKGKRPASPDVDYRENSNNRVVLGPQKPLNLQSGSSSDEESSGERGKHARRAGSSKHRHRKRSSEEKSDAKKKKKKKRDNKRNKHHK